MIWRERVYQEVLRVLGEHDVFSTREQVARDIADALPSPDERNGYAIVPIAPTEAMVDAGLAPTVAWQDIEGSKLTVNREKMRRRFSAMVKSAQ